MQLIIKKRVAEFSPVKWLKPLVCGVFLLQSVLISAQTFQMGQNSSINICSGTLYDSGGAAGNYLNNENETVTICPIDGNCAYIDILSLDLQDGDYLEVYDGDQAIASNLLSVIDNSFLPNELYSLKRGSSVGCMTLRFVSDAILPAGGFEIELGCNPCPLASSTAEQDCINAIPVCNELYIQNNSYIGDGAIDAEILNTCLLQGEKNDVWYVLTVQESGDLSFLISPNSATNNDYDFAVFDITQDGCAGLLDNSTTTSPVIACNYSKLETQDMYLQTGLYSAAPYFGTGNSANADESPYGASLPVVAGQILVINISNFLTTQDGYVLDLTASTAEIYDATAPVVTDIDLPSECGDNTITIYLSEPVRCVTVETCDFEIQGVDGAHSVDQISGCETEEYTSTIELTIDPPFGTAGNYHINLAAIGSNTCGSITDYCGNELEDFLENFSIANNLVPTNINGATTTCVTSNETYTASGFVEYEWSVQGGSIIGANNDDNVDINWGSGSTGVITLIVGDGSGCSVSSSINIDINQPDCDDFCPHTLNQVLADCACSNPVDPSFDPLAYCPAGQSYNYSTCACESLPTTCGDQDCTTEDITNADGTCEYLSLPALTYAVTDQLCNANNTLYDIEITLSGGIGNGYVLDAGIYTAIGDPNSGLYTIYDVPSGSGLSISIQEGNGCSEVVQLAPYSCACPTIPAPANPQNLALCAEDAITAISVDPSPNGYDTYWYNAPGSSDILGFANSFTPSAEGTYYAVYADGICLSEPTAVTLSINPVLSYDTTYICNPDNLTYNIAIALDGGSGSGYSIATASNNIVQIDDSNFEIENIDSGQSVSITITDGLGCELEVDLDAHNCGCPQIPAAQNLQAIYQCFNDPIPSFTIDALPLGQIAHWMDEDNNELATGISFTPVAPGDYTVYISSGNCESEYLTESFIAYAEITAIGSTECAANNTSYSYTFSIAGGSESGYDIDGLWPVVNNPDGSFTIENIPIDQDLEFTITDDQFCNQDYTITHPDCNCTSLNTMPTNPIGQQLCVGEEFDFISVDQPNAPLSCVWTNGMGTVLATTNNYLPTNTGTYYVYLTNGICNSDSIAVNVSYFESLTIENTSSICSADNTTYDFSFEAVGGIGNGIFVDVPANMVSCIGNECTITGIEAGQTFSFNIIDSQECVYDFSTTPNYCNGCTPLNNEMAIPTDTLCVTTGTAFDLTSLLTTNTDEGYFTLAADPATSITEYEYDATQDIEQVSLLFRVGPPATDPDDCPYLDSLFVLSFAHPSTTVIASDMTLCNQASIPSIPIADLVISGDYNGSWTADNNSLVVDPMAQVIDVTGLGIGTATLTYTTDEPASCPDEVDQLLITIEECNIDHTILIPSAFSPNGDGRNDEFNFIGTAVSASQMKIFDRWGKLVFASEDPLKGWNGLLNGTLCELGVYVYMLEIVYDDGQSLNRKGNVTLIR